MKITSRQYGGYKKARKDWISQNDAYNKEHFGITKTQYFKIHGAVVDLTGVGGGTPSLAAVNRRLG